MRGSAEGLDRAIIEFDRALRTLAGITSPARAEPGREIAEADLQEAERRHAAADHAVPPVFAVAPHRAHQAWPARVGGPGGEALVAEPTDHEPGEGKGVKNRERQRCHMNSVSTPV